MLRLMGVKNLEMSRNSLKVVRRNNCSYVAYTSTFKIVDKKLSFSNIAFFFLSFFFIFYLFFLKFFLLSEELL